MNLLRHMLRLWLVLAFSGPALAQTITVYSSYKIEVGASRQLTAYVPLSPNTVTWTVNGIPGGDATVGTISPTGVYRAPAAVPQQNAVKVRATSTAYPTKYGEATMTVTQVGVHLWSSYPSTVAPGAFTLRLAWDDQTSFERFTRTWVGVWMLNGMGLARDAFARPIETHIDSAEPALRAGKHAACPTHVKNRSAAS